MRLAPWLTAWPTTKPHLSTPAQDGVHRTLTVFAVLDRLHARAPIGLLIHGDARGADRLAAEWAESREVAMEAYEADWDRHGYAAGSVRNRDMLERGRPDALIAFPGGRGAAHMIRIAREAGLPVAASGGGLSYAIDETPALLKTNG